MMELERNEHLSTAVTMEVLSLVLTDEWQTVTQVFEAFSEKAPHLGMKTRHTVMINLMKMSRKNRAETKKEACGRYSKRYFRRVNGPE